MVTLAQRLSIVSLEVSPFFLACPSEHAHSSRKKKKEKEWCLDQETSGFPKKLRTRTCQKTASSG